MAFEHEKRTARSLLAAIEDGTLDASDTYSILENEDPTLVYLVFMWIRATYPPSHPAADGVIGRLANLCSPTQRPPAKRRRAKQTRLWIGLRMHTDTASLTPTSSSI